jgi:hypothetical protein
MSLIFTNQSFKQKWKWYENSKWGYKIKYPADWKVTEKSENFTYFHPPEYKGVHCDIFINKGEDIESMIITGNETDQETKKEKLNISKISNFNLDGVPAFRIKVGNKQTTWIIIFTEKDDFIYHLYFFIPADEFDKWNETFQQMLDAFKFI